MDQNSAAGMSIQITLNGPYIVKGSVPLKVAIIEQGPGNKILTTVKEFPLQETYALCRSGKSATPPFCDGSHVAAGFEGTEVASRAAYVERTKVIDGDELFLFDDHRCALARFCHRSEGDAWSLTQDAGIDKHLQEEAIAASSECPSGRLVHMRKDDETVLEPLLKPQITVLEDPEKGVSGALFVQGGIVLKSADSSEYELRNRYTLCRCGSSDDKPFCDATHVYERFKDHLDTSAG